MNKQEEIQEITESFVADAMLGKNFDEGDIKPIATCLLSTLHSRGVVIKVERDVPDSLCAGCSCYHVKNGRIKFKEELGKAGYEAVDPLIEEE
ncbi:hypothetical protein LCGC14_1671650 [marine sediment metagenome]|uniref:Uncharacterized protein n=1 Tax=marine sediment metagenome TaxID=412755 RepID=A0A0F9HRU7_9ZZZZ